MSDGIEKRVREPLGSDELGRTLAETDMDEAEALVRSTLRQQRTAAGAPTSSDGSAKPMLPPPRRPSSRCSNRR